MTGTETTCELVDEGDLDTRYLAGRLSPDEAEAFEAHFFGCERCWGLVQQGLAVHSAFQGGAVLPGPSAGAVRSGGAASRRWWGLAAAAGIAAVAVGLWQLGVLQEPSQPEDVLRGYGAPFALATAANETTLTAAWPRLAEADVYRVRLYGADGMLALERETSDTSATVPRDSISLPAATEMFWEVQALDRLRNSVARSDLTRAVLPDP